MGKPFNLKKSYNADPFQQMMTDVPMGYNPVASHYLWNSVYANDPAMDSMADMFRDMSPEDIQMEYERMSNPEVVEELPQDAVQIDDAKQQMSSVIGVNASVKKPFNLKKAQGGFAPDMMELQNDMEQDLEPNRKFQTHSDLNNMLLQLSTSKNAFQIAWNEIMAENPKESDSAQSALKSYFQGLETKGDEQRLDEADIIYKLIYGNEESMTIKAPYEHIGSVNEIIKKLAQKTANKDKKKAFNLTKTAQHKTMDNAILWGPGQTRIDPFLHQPVSDWHIVERNKGFGLVVDDVWNIDYETIWRENVMDKYSRPYKNKEGDWVGGYIQKRFEVDKNIPETNNMQLKPGQLRRPVLPEYGSTESRMQAARSAGDIAGANDTSKPFNWKEASKKKR